MLGLLLTLGVAWALEPDEPAHKFFVGTSAFVLYNAIPDPEPPGFFQLNAGYRITDKDVLSLEAITWQYHKPLGIPYGAELSDPNNRYPGKVRALGVGIAYQRFLWRGLYTAIHAVPFYQQYISSEGKKLQTGFQLFMTGRVGYHIPIGKRVFVEPSIAGTAWPIQTNVPADFQATEADWRRYFLVEPGLHLGVRF